MKSTKSSRQLVPSFVQKLFIYSTIAVYSASILMNLVYMTSPDGIYPIAFVQLLLMSIPLVLAFVVYLSRSDRALNQGSLFAILVVTFSLFMVYIAVATVFTPLLLEIAYNDSLGSEAAIAVSSMYETINAVVQLGVTVLLVAGFLYATKSARARGEW